MAVGRREGRERRGCGEGEGARRGECEGCMQFLVGLGRAMAYGQGQARRPSRQARAGRGRMTTRGVRQHRTPSDMRGASNDPHACTCEMVTR